MDFETFIQNSNECKSADELYRLFMQAVAGMGFERSVYSLLTPHLSIGLQAGHPIMHNYPDDWLSYYRSMGYQHHDPVIKHLFRTSYAFSWEEMVKSTGLTRKEGRVMREAEDARLCAGIGIPLRGINHEFAAIGLATHNDGGEIDKRLLNTVQAYGCQFHTVYTSIVGTKNKNEIQLSAREREVLLWFAEGKSLDEISNILGISFETVRSYQKAIYRKLGVNKQTLAVLTALRNGLINPYRIDF